MLALSVYRDARHGPSRAVDERRTATWIWAGFHPWMDFRQDGQTMMAYFPAKDGLRKLNAESRGKPFDGGH